MPKGTWQRASRPELEDRDWLFERYVTQAKTAAEIGRELGCSKYCALRWLNRAGIPMRHAGPARKVAIVDWSAVTRMYEDGVSLTETGLRFGVSTATVAKILERQGVPRRRPGTQIKKRQSKAWPTLMQDGWLEREYTLEGKSIQTIAGQLECSLFVVRRALEDKQIPVRCGSSRRGPTRARKLSARHALQIKKQFRACALCASPDDLEVHHRDGDRTNDTPENLIVLCRDCHAVAEWFIRPVEARLRGLATSLPV